MVAGGLPPSPEARDEGISVPAFLSAAIRSWPGPMNAGGEAGLEALCRKLAVAKRVKIAYDSSWKRALSQEDLPIPYWPALIALLLAEFQSNAATLDQVRGVALKRLNAAYSAMEIATALIDVPHLSELARWADVRLTALTGR